MGPNNVDNQPVDLRKLLPPQELGLLRTQLLGGENLSVHRWGEVSLLLVYRQNLAAPRLLSMNPRE